MSTPEQQPVDQDAAEDLTGSASMLGDAVTPEDLETDTES
ncbi:MAG: hypothetical protein JWN57_2434 [Frankiales bacterium]|jgi:hypothetical protein|nr:hypothetical protein [Frankiales bacterium]